MWSCIFLQTPEYDKVTKILAKFPNMHAMTAQDPSKLKVDMDAKDILAYPLLQW